MSETERIKSAYRKRALEDKDNLYSFFRPAHLFYIQRREQMVLEVLLRKGIHSLKDKSFLEIGCGNGSVLRDFVQYGAMPENCFGIDLVPEHVTIAEKVSPNIEFVCASAENLPYGNDSFDIVLQFTVFTSILNGGMKSRIASEMMRVLKPDGMILWYDYHMDNPRNPDVRGVRKKEIYELFPGCHIELKRITLAPPLARALVPHSVILCQLLEKLPFLCTHYLGVIKKA